MTKRLICLCGAILALGSLYVIGEEDDNPCLKECEPCKVLNEEECRCEFSAACQNMGPRPSPCWTCTPDCEWVLDCDRSEPPTYNGDTLLEGHCTEDGECIPPKPNIGSKCDVYYVIDADQGNCCEPFGATIHAITECGETLDVEVEISCAEESGCSACRGSAGNLKNDFGDGYAMLKSLFARISMGRDLHGKPAGFIQLHQEEPGVEAYQIASLDFPDFDQTGIKILKHADRSLKQIHGPQGLADFVTITSYVSEVRFYMEQYVQYNYSNRMYETSADPFVVWRISNPLESTQDVSQVKIEQIFPTETNQWLFAWSETNQGWTLALNDNLVKQSLFAESSGSMITETFTSMDAADQVANKKITIYEMMGALKRPLIETEDPDGVALTTLKEYYSNPAESGRYRQLKKVIYPDGRWIKYDYDNQRRKTKAIRPWGHAADTAPESECHVTLFDYTPVDPLDDGQSYMAQKPRKTTEKIEDTVVSVTYNAYYTNASPREYVQVSEKAATPTSSYGDPSNLRSIKIFTFARRLRRTIAPDGGTATYVYNRGSYIPQEAGPGSFSGNSTGSAYRTTITYGTTNKPKGIAYQTTREIEILDKGLPVQKETQVYNGSSYVTVDWQVTEYDDRDRILHEYYASGKMEDFEWGGDCCGLVSETDTYGVETRYEYDAIGRRIARTEIGAGEQPDVRIDYYLDAEGRTLGEVVSADGLSLSITNAYNPAGQLLETTSREGLTTSYDVSDGGRIQTVIEPSGATRTTVKQLDGRMSAVTGTAVTARFYDYGVNPDGSQYTIVYTGPEGTNSPVWEKTTSDFLGRTVKIERPAFGGGLLVTSNVYDNAGRLVRVSQTGQPDTLYVYDELGDVVLSGQDVDGNGALDLASSDRISSNSARYVQLDGTWWKESAQYQFPDAGSARSVRVSLNRSAISGSSCGCGAGERQTVDILGNTNIVVMTIDRDTKTKTVTTTYADSIQPAVSVEVNGRLVSQTTKTGVTTEFDYDPLGRRCSVRSVSGESSNRLVGTISHYNDYNQVDYIEDMAGNRTTFVYDSAGRRTATIDALSNATYFAYDIRGQLTNTWGATYPVAYVFDDYGRMVQMKTWRDESGAADTTTWHYDEATGLLTNKVYADGNGPSYTYDSAGRLTQRSWARGIDTDYSYDSLGQLTNVSYSDFTPDIDYTYDRLGRQISAITVGVSTNLFAYDPATLALTQEVIQVSGFSPQPSTHLLSRSHDSFGRPSGIAMGPDYAVDYGYDSYGRFGQVSSSVHSACSVVEYSYLQNSDLLLGHAVLDPASGITNLASLKSFEPNRDLITTVHNRAGTNLISGFSYQNDALGRRISRIDSGPAFGLAQTNQFSYNVRSEVSSAEMRNGQSSYEFDPIGNREYTDEAGTVRHWQANELNQYTAISNGTTQTPAYDSDGNLIFYNGWTYAWNAENRLIRATNSLYEIEYAYDHMGRMVAKTRDGVTTTYLWDDYNIIASLSTLNSQPTTNYFVWGLDLSGTLQGAGGVGGLLAEIQVSGLSPQPSCVFATYDANGNVSEYVSELGHIAAHREFDAFGNTISSYGPHRNSLTHWWSTKPWDHITGLSEYEYRKYMPELGRWLSRDPIGERGGLNICGFVNNDPMKHWDFLGNGFKIGPIFEQPDNPDNLEDAACVGLYAIIEVITDEFHGSVEEAFDEIVESGEATLENLTKEALRQIWDQITNLGKNDGYKHCVVSCKMAQDAGPNSAEAIGDFVEFLDALAAEAGIPAYCEVRDFVNNHTGRNCADDCNYDSCEDCCSHAPLE